MAKYNVEITADDAGLPQNEKEEMKELLKTGWHHVREKRRDKWSRIDKEIDVLCIDVSIGSGHIRYFTISFR